MQVARNAGRMLLMLLACGGSPNATSLSVGTVTVNSSCLTGECGTNGLKGKVGIVSGPIDVHRARCWQRGSN